MRIQIEIDDELMRDARLLTGIETEQEVVELGLRALLRLGRQEQIRRFKGKLDWQGDLDEMRTDR